MFALLDKQKGISSFKAINSFKKENNIKKIGHTGTLDPLATGLLLVATDDDTKLIDYIDKGDKTYIATMRLGYTSNTFDSEGDIEFVSNTLPSKAIIANELEKCVGVQKQMPPIFSAKKINGIPAYKLARKGFEVKLKASTIKINRIKLLDYTDDIVTFKVNVSRGTYIRSLINDLGQALGCGAIMVELRRTTIGTLTEKNIGLDINIESMLTLPIVKLDLEQVKLLSQGIVITNNSYNIGKYILKSNDTICGVVNIEKNIIKSEKLFGNKIGQIK